MEMPTAGELRNLITLKSWQDAPNASAGLDKNYTAPVKAWAKIEPVGAAIYHGTQQTDNAITHRFYIRFITGITVDQVIEHSGIRYRIKRASDLMFRQQFLVIEAEELGAI